MDFKDIFEDKVVLITGGTGYLGRALTKEILKYNPQSIRLFSRDEVKHHKTQELFSYHPKLRNLIGDVRDYQRLRRATERVDIVIHAAALKRLDILEYNVGESIKTNILGTLNMITACLENNVNKAVFVSTDKACSPINTYGACKFVGEKIFTESNYNKGQKKTIFTCVRYGNVLQSTGSVIPFFESKLINDEKIPLTHPDMTRFIISPYQAAKLIFNALKYAIGGEIFIPKLKAFKIVDLIEILKEKHEKDADIELIGIRPGEKIHELMINESEVPRTYDFKDMFVISSLIEKYQKIKIADYVENGIMMDGNKMNEYSSRDSVISRKEIKTLFKELGLL
ncbi:MAG: SDR family NAD(P)-dependent oxidoreductase [Candidatus Hodarchaeota archaeon]